MTKEEKINKLIDAAWNMFSDIRNKGLTEKQALKTVIMAMLKKISKKG
jgi:hypothetical protein